MDAHTDAEPEHLTALHSAVDRGDQAEMGNRQEEQMLERLDRSGHVDRQRSLRAASDRDGEREEDPSIDRRSRHHFGATRPVETKRRRPDQPRKRWHANRAALKEAERFVRFANPEPINKATIDQSNRRLKQKADGRACQYIDAGILRQAIEQMMDHLPAGIRVVAVVGDRDIPLTFKRKHRGGEINNPLTNLLRRVRKKGLEFTIAFRQLA